MSYTPGPWLIESGNYSGVNWLVGSLYLGRSTKENKNYWIHITTDHIHASQMNSDAKDDAHLIAAAPDLLEACQAAYGFIQYIYCHDTNYPELKEPLDKLGKAIDKVKGETP